MGPIVNSEDVAVSDGLFTVELDFGAVFDGVALWLEIAVRPGASTGGYTILSPRQPLTAAPYALGMRPGAVIRQTKTNPALSIESAGDGIQVDDAAKDGIQVGQSGQNGLRVVRAEGAGLRVISAGNGGVYIDHSDQDAIHIDNAGLDGIDINNSGEDGVQVDNAGRHGIRVSSAISSGLYIDHAGDDGIFICSTGTNNGCDPSFDNNGIEIGNAEQDGLLVQKAGYAGLRVDSARYGVLVYGDYYAGYFGGDITVSGYCIGCTLATFAVNSSDQPLQPGDVVTVQGVQASGVDGVPVLMGVVPASAGQSIVGVVDGRAEIRINDEPRPDEIGRQLIPRDGPAQPGDYVTIITYGLAPVNVGDSLSARSITAGSKLALDAGGSARSLQTAIVEGIQITESAPTVGLALSNPDAQGQVWVLVNPQ